MLTCKGAVEVVLNGWTLEVVPGLVVLATDEADAVLVVKARELDLIMVDTTGTLEMIV